MIRVVICDYNQFMRAGILDLIENNMKAFTVTKLVDDGFEFLYLLGTGAIDADVIMLDMDSPSANYSLAAVKIKKFAPQVRILAFSVWNDAQSIVQAIKVGATGFILKESNKKELAAALYDMYAIGFHVNSFVSQEMLDRYCKKEMTVKKNGMDLTKKESELLPFLCSNRTYKEIAAECYTSYKTIDNHCQNIFKKLNVSSRIGLAVRAMQLNLIILSATEIL